MRRRRILVAAILAALLIGAVAISDSVERASSATKAEKALVERPFQLTRKYTVRFWPRWYTYQQIKLSLVNRFVGPAVVNEKWGIVVAPNVDTIYTTVNINLSKQPYILTIPETHVTYSLLTLDVWGNVFETEIDVPGPGTYGLVGPNNRNAKLPAGVKRIEVPYNLTYWIIRADKYAPDGTNHIPEAELFRERLKLRSLKTYKSDPNAGSPLIVPDQFYSPRLKQLAAHQVEMQPLKFLKVTQRGIRSNTAPLTKNDRRLAKRMSLLLKHATENQRARMGLGVQAAYTQIYNQWQNHTGTTNWVNFDNIGHWGRRYLDRAALTEYIQFGNDAKTAGYYFGLIDSKSLPLDASVSPAYVLTFPAGQLPQARRFWSLTAYLPAGLTLFENPDNKYAVASYTPNLHTNADGSVSIYMQPEAPLTVPHANWLPVPEGEFNVLLRVYGPTGNTAKKGYVPPAIKATFRH